MARRTRFKCPNCGNVFELSALSMVVRPHALSKGNYVRCPQCAISNWIKGGPVASG